jgi:hypothetical protein
MIGVIYDATPLPCPQCGAYTWEWDLDEDGVIECDCGYRGPGPVGTEPIVIDLSPNRNQD